MVSVRTLVDSAVEGLVDCLVFWLVMDTSFPVQEFAFGLIAPAYKAPESPRIGFLVRAIFTFPAKQATYTR
jgi:hypothetical protein